MFVVAFSLGWFITKRIFLNENLSLEKLDSLLKEIGMAPGEISNIRNILGDYDDPKKDFHMNFDKDPTKTSKGPKGSKK